VGRRHFADILGTVSTLSAKLAIAAERNGRKT